MGGQERRWKRWKLTVSDVRTLQARLAENAFPTLEERRAFAAEMGVTDHVLFEGSVPFSQLPSTYNLCDVFVTPSRSAPPSVEGFGIVFLEANACGKPVIGARSGGIPDAIVDGETGLLVEPDDEPGLAEALISLLSDPARCRALGDAGRARVEQACTWDVAHNALFRAMSED